MASVDDRIVRMEFDNASFERKISTTLASIGQLDKALKLTGATKGITDVQDAAGRFNMGSMATHIEGISAKFLALSTVAITALANITSHALMAGAQVAKAFTLDPVISGFQEYETQLNSVQTILANTASKGTTLDQVNEALQKLNEYSDQTIYNFGQMAKNIGTFTAAGVDLDTSVQSIKGIANLAAMSGSNSEQASNAMYQLSQAIATGSLKLIDWNSVVNAGMGGEAFKTALYETGKAMGTLTDAPVGQTFKEWEDASGGFRGSLEKGWVTADVLTTTLAGFTGDLTEEMLIQKGYTQEVATSILKTAAMAKAAATEVKTFTQLVGTVKEAVGTGWADSFKIVIGNFTEAKELWTGVNNSIGAFVSKSADARNALLQGWKDAGGRTLLIMSLTNAFRNLSAIMAPIKEAFREIFPPMTVDRLLEMTKAFAEFTGKLKPSGEMIQNLKSIFGGLFAALSIGWTVIKEGVKFFYSLVSSMIGLGGPSIMNAAATIGDILVALQAFLVKGGGIKDFFNTLRDAIKSPLPFLQNFGDLIGKLFGGFDKETAEKVGDSVGRIGDRFESLKVIFEKMQDLWKPFQDAMGKIVSILDTIWDAVVGFFKELGSKIASVMGEGSFSEALDKINVLLLGGIAALLAKFIKSGFTFDIGGGMFDKIGKSFEQLTGVLKSMQMKVKAEALMKIAIAIGILTASVIALSLIDSGALTKSLTAMAVGFGQLMASFAIITQMNMGPSSAAQFALVATGMILLSAAMLVLAGAIKVLSTIDPGDMATALAAIGVSLGLMTGATILISKHAGSIFLGSIAIVAMSAAMVILAGAVKLFSMMAPGEIAHGLIAIGASLILIGLAMKLMPLTMPLTAAGLILVGIALGLIGGAVALFGTMDIETMARGILGIAGALIVIGFAMGLMPLTMPLTAAGLILVGIALTEIGGALMLFGGMDWGEIGRGLVGMAGALLILSVAAYAMSGSLVGAIAIGVMAISLGALAVVLQTFADIPLGDILKGLLGLGIALLGLGLIALIMTPFIPFIILLGATLLIVGAAFVLAGAGALLIAKAFEMLAKTGVAGAKAFGEAIEEFGKSIPKLAQGLALGFIEFIKAIAEAGGPMLEAIGKLLSMLIDKLVELVPKLGELIRAVMEEVITTIEFYIPRLIEAGINIIMSLLSGIRDNLPLIVTIVGEIITGFLNALAENMQSIIDAGVNLIVTFIQGITDSLDKIITAVGELITQFIESVATFYGDIIKAGADALVQFLKGISDNITMVFWTVILIIAKMIETLTAGALLLVQAGADALSALLKGITDNALAILWTAAWVIVQFMTGIANMATYITTEAVTVIDAFLQGLADNINRLVWAGLSFILALMQGVSDNLYLFASTALTIITEFLKKMRELIDGPQGEELERQGRLLAGAIINGITFGWAEKVTEVWDMLGAFAKEAKDKLTHPWELLSPSHVTQRYGAQIAEGFAVGFHKDTTVEHAATDLMTRTAMSFKNAIATVTEDLGSMDEFNPVITPVLDLTRVASDAARISDYISSDTLNPAYSYAQAQTIASTSRPSVESEKSPGETSGVTFQQTINAPTQLSTADIYRQTRNQITMAKEELSIP